MIIVQRIIRQGKIENMDLIYISPFKALFIPIMGGGRQDKRLVSL
jgi:hypothetical protein